MDFISSGRHLLLTWPFHVLEKKTRTDLPRPFDPEIYEKGKEARAGSQEGVQGSHHHCLTSYERLCFQSQGYR
jgi:hypothetical protein